MSDKPNGLTKATGITADLVLEIGQYYSAQDMRKVQTGLTSAAREIRALTQYGSLLGRLGEKLSHEQRELLSNAAALLDSVKYNVEHAKEQKARAEKALAKKRQLWGRQAEHLVNAHFSMPTESVTDQLRVLELYLVARTVLGNAFYMKDNISLRKMMQDEPPRRSHYTVSQWRRSEVSSLLADIKSALRDYLSLDLAITPDELLHDFQLNIDRCRQEVLSHPQSAEIISIWSEALKSAAFITRAMAPGGPSR